MCAPTWLHPVLPMHTPMKEIPNGLQPSQVEVMSGSKMAAGEAEILMLVTTSSGLIRSTLRRWCWKWLALALNMPLPERMKMVLFLMVENHTN